MSIKVKDLIQYLTSLNPEAEVILDKDGWMEDELPEGYDNQKIIANRGLFYKSSHAGHDYVIINN